MEYNGVNLELLGHASFKIKGEKTIYIDPFQIKETEHADLILITHAHYDHCSPDDVKKISDESTIIITVADCLSKLNHLKAKEIKMVEPGDRFEIDGIVVEAVPAYNTNKEFHPQENGWVGFVVTMNNTRIYHAGDTDVITEMADLKNIDIAILPVSGTYVMTAEEAAEAVEMIKPKLAIPMHYGAIVGSPTDADLFEEVAGCDVEILK